MNQISLNAEFIGDAVIHRIIYKWRLKSPETIEILTFGTGVLAYDAFPDQRFAPNVYDREPPAAPRCCLMTG